MTSSMDDEMVESIIALTNITRTCLGSLVPEYRWLVRNGGNTQKDLIFFLLFWLVWERSSMSLIVLTSIRSWKVGTGVGVDGGGNIFLSSN